MAMKPMAIALCGLLLLASRAQGLVGGAPLATEDIARSVIGIVGPNSFFCTATAIAHNFVLTAGHCVRSGPNYKVQYKDTNGLREFADIVDWERPPQFILRANGANADIAILKLANSLPDYVGVATLGLSPVQIWPGDRFTVIGGGVALKGLHETGINRVVALAAAAPYSDLQIRLVDPSGNQAPIGACFGDSGAPVFQTRKDGTKVIGVVSWTGTPDKIKGCGSTTGATPLSPYRQWIQETVSKLGGILGNAAAPN
jgi:hypothetical protein